MQMRQLRSHFGHPQLSRTELVASCATEFVETGRLLALLIRAFVLRYLDNHGHCRQHSNAPFKPLRPFLAFGRVAELAVVTDGVATLATMRVKHVSGEFFWAGIFGDHLVQLWRRLIDLGKPDGI